MLNDFTDRHAQEIRSGKLSNLLTGVHMKKRIAGKVPDSLFFDIKFNNFRYNVH